ncbi:hypothetical protein WKH57_15155 [Niallia taxi]|uniref:hypothetical protein n=1 Tax=Niallia taxi TaxID=2499688 RepID=UPI003176C53C
MVKLKITTHSGNEYEATVEEYDPIKINTDLNAAELNTVVLGNVIVSRIDVKSVTPIEEAENTEKQEA